MLAIIVFPVLNIYKYSTIVLIIYVFFSQMNLEIFRSSRIGIFQKKKDIGK